MLPYLTPLVINTFLLARFFHYLNRDSIRITGFLELGLLGWLSSGFSETVFALQAGFWILILVLSIIIKLKSGRNAAIAIIIGTILGAVLLIFNPTNVIRQKPFPPPPEVWTLVFTSVRFAFDFLLSTFRGYWLPLCSLIFCGILIGWLEKPFRKFDLRSAIKIVGALSFVCIFLLTCIMAPTFWSMSVFPEPRGLLSGVYIIVIYLGLVGIILGSSIASNYEKRGESRIEKFAITVLILLLSIYLMHFFPSLITQISTFQKRAGEWDFRDAQILELKIKGQTRLIVPGINSISKIIELQPNESFWVNRCSAIYYGVDSIASTE